MKRQSIFFFHKDKKIVVKPQLLVTKYEVKLNEREIFVFEIKDSDTLYNRAIIIDYINRLTELN